MYKFLLHLLNHPYNLLHIYHHQNIHIFLFHESILFDTGQYKYPHFQICIHLPHPLNHFYILLHIYLHYYIYKYLSLLFFHLNNLLYIFHFYIFLLYMKTYFSLNLIDIQIFLFLKYNIEFFLAIF